MFCARIPRTTDPAEPEAADESVQAIDDLVDAIVHHESEHYAPDLMGNRNGRCVECGSQTDPLHIIMQVVVENGENTVDTVYCPVCEPGLAGHPAQHYVYV